MQVAKWHLGRVSGRRRERPLVEQETVEGAIYIYAYRYGELRRLVRPHFRARDVRGITSFESFPINWLPRALRYRADAWMERSRLGRLFGWEMFFRLRRSSSTPDA